MLKDAFEWIWDKALELWPIGVMDEYQRGIRLLFGRPVREWRWAFWRESPVCVLRPGLYLSLPFIHRAIEVEVTTRTVSVMPVPVTTTDNVSVKLGANVRFRVSNVCKWLLDVHSPVDTLINECESVLTLFASRLEWNVEWNVKDVNEKLTRALRRRASRWGVNVEAVELNCFMEVKPYQVFGDTSAGLLPVED